MKKLLKAIIDWFNSPMTYQYESELDYLAESVDHADLKHRLGEVKRVQRYRANVALEKGYL